ncbi:MAG: HEAT repeat domain-containing protein [Candidatus Heimdallarchaeota archaeon]
MSIFGYILGIFVFGAESFVDYLIKEPISKAVGKWAKIIKEDLFGDHKLQLEKKAIKILKKKFIIMAEVICLDKKNQQLAIKKFNELIQSGSNRKLVHLGLTIEDIYQRYLEADDEDNTNLIINFTIAILKDIKLKQKYIDSPELLRKNFQILFNVKFMPELIKEIYFDKELRVYWDIVYQQDIQRILKINNKMSKTNLESIEEINNNIKSLSEIFFNYSNEYLDQLREQGKGIKNIENQTEKMQVQLNDIKDEITKIPEKQNVKADEINNKIDQIMNLVLNIFMIITADNQDVSIKEHKDDDFEKSKLVEIEYGQDERNLINNLENILPLNVKQEEEIQSLLTNITNDQTSKIDLIEKLKKKNTKSIVKPLVNFFINDKNFLVRRAALWAIESVFGESSVPIFIAFLEKESNEDIMDIIISNLGNYKAYEGMPLLRKLVKTSNVRIKNSCKKSIKMIEE